MQTSLQDVVNEITPVLRGFTDDEVNRPCIAGGWSRKQILGHLIDSASNNHQRFVRALLAPELDAPAYDQQGNVRVERFADADWTMLVDLWTSYNRVLAHILRGVPDNKLATPCRIGGAQAITLEELAIDYVRHLEHHLSQIRAADSEPRA
jgi:hypothetical protein